MAAYNAEKYIAESIGSIINQTLENHELLVINDGSTDGTQQIVEDFCKKDFRIRLINNPENRFVIESRNIGIRNARGKYIAILDSDDLSLPDRLEKQVNYLENNPETFLVGSSAMIIDGEDRYLKDYVATIGYEKIKNGIAKDNLVYHSTAMFRNEQVFYREKMFFCEDYDLMLQLIADNKIIDNLPEKLVKYRSTEKSLSKRNDRLIQWLFLNKAREFYKEKILLGKDSYDSFDPDRFMKINDMDYPIDEKDLGFALKICFYRSDMKMVRFLLKKYKKNYPVSKTYLFYSVISTHKFLFTLFQKFYSKL
jgi:glycosyltransferase involved in cell wall biosynthesis